MPEDLPKAVFVLVWLLVGVIILGYLIMEHTVVSSIIFAVLFYGVPTIWYVSRKKKEQTKMHE
jgi:high-affinity Fe2+/Pb2+ permease